METLRDLFEHIISSNPSSKELLRARAGRDWRTYTVQEFAEATRKTASRLAQAGIGAGDRVALFSENRPEWHIVDFACHLLGAVVVPLYANLPAGHVRYIVADSEAKALIVAGRDRASAAVEAGLTLPGVRLVGLDPGLAGVEPLEMLPVSAGGTFASPPRGATDLASIVYTSGTTGEPKGVMLTHRNFMFEIITLRPLYPITDHDEVMSFLPLAHISQRVTDYVFLYSGCHVTYVDPPERVVDMITRIRPTIMVSIPRVYERAYGKIHSTIEHEGGVKAKLFGWAMRVGRRAREAVWQGRAPSALTSLQYALAKKLVFSKILGRLGGRLKFTFSGAAPLAREIAEFFDIVGLPLLNGYGLTEAPVIAIGRLESNKIGSIGPIVPGVEVRIADDGEILTRGPHLMTGYWKKRDATAEAIDAEGWLHTGDIGHLDRDGHLFITDRKKNLLATAGGKKIAPEPIEARLRASPYVAQAVLIGDNLPYVTALIVPNFENLEAYFTERGLNGKDREALANHDVTEALIAAAVKDANSELAQYERIRRFTVLTREFSLDEGEITPTLKARRRVITDRFRQAIDQMYLKTHRTAQFALDD
jgi:long-chain acyl-CoA synthetase